MISLKAKIALLPLCLLAGCGSSSVKPPVKQYTEQKPFNPYTDIASRYGQALRASKVTRNNATLARDFIALTFENEAGETRETLLRWPNRINVSLASEFAAQRPFLEAFLADLAALTGLEIGIDQRAAARIDITPVIKDEAPGDVMCSAAYSESWTDLQRPSKARVSIPAGAAPHQVRRCLIEEIAQLLGPINDLSSLSQSMFNDDDAHHRLTATDKLFLKLLYSDYLIEGMTRSSAKKAALRGLAELNPGKKHGRAQNSPEDSKWQQAYRLGTQALLEGRARNVDRFLHEALKESARFTRGDHRRVKTLTSLAYWHNRGQRVDALQLARRAVSEAEAGSERGGVRHAEALMQLAFASATQGDGKGARANARASIDIALDWEREDLLATGYHFLARFDPALKKPRDNWVSYAYADTLPVRAPQEVKVAGMSQSAPKTPKTPCPKAPCPASFAAVEADHQDDDPQEAEKE